MDLRRSTLTLIFPHYPEITQENMKMTPNMPICGGRSMDLRRSTLTLIFPYYPESTQENLKNDTQHAYMWREVNGPPEVNPDPDISILS
jgi:hypothetical protein